jgi:hypothetical protein
VRAFRICSLVPRTHGETIRCPYDRDPGASTGPGAHPLRVNLTPRLADRPSSVSTILG